MREEDEAGVVKERKEVYLSSNEERTTTKTDD
jgi:hypothetical protein